MGQYNFNKQFPYSLLLLFSLLISSFLIIYSWNKGFDLSDEGFYLLMADPLQSNEFNLTRYDLFFKIVHEFFHFEFGIASLRIIRYILYLITLIPLALVVIQHNQLTSRTLIFNISITILLSLFLSYGFQPHSLSYNHLNVFFSSCLIFLIYKLNNNQALSVWKILWLGLILGFIFYIKISTALLLTIVSLVLLIKRHRFTYKLFIIILPLCVFELIFYFRLNQSLLQSVFLHSSLNFNRTDYGIFDLSKNLIVGGVWTSLFFCSGILIAKSSKIKNLYYKTAFIIFILVIILWCLAMVKIAEPWVFLYPAVLLIILGFLSLHYIKKRTRGEDLVIYLLLLFFPFILHAGSNLYFYWVNIHYSFSWVILIFLISKDNPQLRRFVFLLILGSPLLIWDGLWNRPFQQCGIVENINSYSYREGKEIYISTSLFNLLGEIKNRLTEHEEIDLIPLYRNPGINYLLGKQVPYIPGYWDQNHFKAIYKEGKNKRLFIYNGVFELPKFDSEEDIILFTYPRDVVCVE
ncbi:hypothetical protein Belba_2536 [Belliella baltica DSM 15883]|uniref:Glycosyltransferase RgtA/B/C/D-like domain-containing protein n=1 Tax=Belliella baltica (strain DSM 15883 / CIP 108006 / LMG 21964 / BA134) TaxID=866536 RepID=I3Z771_BELBD|nr:hypothetical protein Belba_2536 [Belliella baltica DSM 15883]